MKQKSWLAAWLAVVWVWASCAGAFAEAAPPDDQTGPVRIHAALPEVTIAVADTGERMPDALRENVLRATVRADDGSVLQQFSYLSSESPAAAPTAAMVMPEDVNFDGYQDLLLLTGMGARNVFYAVCLWNEEQGLFDPVEQALPYDRETKRLASAAVQMELCNPVYEPERKAILSDEQDGYRYSTQIYYVWQGRYDLQPLYVWDVYDAGEGRIGETLARVGDQYLLCWDEQYPESWYYGEDGAVYEERRAAAHQLMIGGEPARAAVAHVDWVNLRKQSSKQSPSLARLTAGTEVLKLHDGTGTDNGWVRVWVRPGEGGAGLTGYVWHSYLKEAPAD